MVLNGEANSLGLTVNESNSKEYYWVDLTYSI